MNQPYKPTAQSCAEWIKDHQYTQLAKTKDVEVWRAQTPGTHSYAFDLVISRYGMAMYGDTGVLVFDVGAGYGLNFLTRTDDHYVFSKLDECSRAKDLDEAYLLDIVYRAIIDLLSERDLELPEWLPSTEPMAARVEQLERWLLGSECKDGEHSALFVALRACQSLENRSTSGAYEWLSEHQELLELADDMDYSLGKPTNAVMQRIYMLRHAATQILAQQAAVELAAAQPAIEYAYATAHESEQWHSDSLASFVSDNEIAAGTEVFRGVVDRPKASSFMVDSDDIINHMANQAYDNNSEYADNFPDLKPEQEEELKGLLAPLQEWADKSCDVNFYTVEQIEPYIVTPDDVAAAGAYLKALTEGAQV